MQQLRGSELLILGMLEHHQKANVLELDQSELVIKMGRSNNIKGVL
jgi:hypothetical protein